MIARSKRVHGLRMQDGGSKMTRSYKQGGTTKKEVKDRLLSFLDEIIDDPELTVKDKLKAVEMMGKEFGLFAEQKNVKIDVNSVVRHFTTGQLSGLIGEGNVLKTADTLPPGDTIDIDPVRLLDRGGDALREISGDGDESSGPRGED
jgi:hypothetical protein